MAAHKYISSIKNTHSNSKTLTNQEILNLPASRRVIGSDGVVYLGVQKTKSPPVKLICSPMVTSSIEIESGMIQVANAGIYLDKGEIIFNGVTIQVLKGAFIKSSDGYCETCLFYNWSYLSSYPPMYDKAGSNPSFGLIDSLSNQLIVSFLNEINYGDNSHRLGYQFTGSIDYKGLTFRENCLWRVTIRDRPGVAFLPDNIV